MHLCVISSWSRFTKRKPNCEFYISLLMPPVCLQSVVCLAYMWYVLDLSVLPICIVYLLCLYGNYSVLIEQYRKHSMEKGTRNYLQKYLTEFYKGRSYLMTIADPGEHSEFQILLTCIYVGFCFRLLSTCLLLSAND